MQSVVEITTPVCRTAAEIGAELRRLRAHVAEVARAEGCRYASAGTHPFSLFERQRITAKDRYRRLVEQLQYIARRELIFGMHVHTSVDDPDKAIAVTNALVPHLAELLALSASSPFWRGEPTGLQSSRQMVFSAFPRSGVPPRFSSYAEYAELIGQLERTGAIADYTHIWWDIRVHARLGTVELRICDAVTNVDDVVAIAAYFQALVKHYCEQYEAGRKLDGLPPDPDRREQVPRGALRPRRARDGPRHRRERASAVSQLVRRTLARARAARARARLASASWRGSRRSSRAATAPTASSGSGTRTTTSPRSCATSRRRPRSGSAACPSGSRLRAGRESA